MATVTVTATQVRPLPGYVAHECEATEAMNVGDVCQINGSEKAEMANATAAAGVKGTLGIVVSGSRHAASGAIVAGERVVLVLNGRVYLGESAALDETKTYYTGAVDGDIVDVPTTYARPIGTPTGATVLNFAVTSTEAGSP